MSTTTLLPGCDRQLAGSPQLYSRVGFVHQCQPLDPENTQPVVTRYWQQLDRATGLVRASDVDAANTITRIAGGNFRLIDDS